MKNLSWHIILAGSLILSQCTRDVSDLIRDQKPLNSGAGSVTITQSGGNTRTTEGGTGDDYTVVLTSQPAANVTITVNAGSQLSATPTSMVFSASCPGATCWSTARTVTVAATDDALPESNHTGTITHTATSTDSAYNGIAIASVTAKITDNDSPGISITESGGSTAATEGGAGDSYTVVLTFAPTATVTITVTPNAQVTATPTPLTFTTGNWNVPQTVTVNATNDGVTEGAHNGSITHTASSADGGYNGIAVENVTVNITDNANAVPVYLFKSTGTTNGNFGGRTGANTICSTARGLLTFPVNSCSTVVAFISIDNATDELLDIPVPAGRPIHGPTGILFQNDWTDLLNGVELVTADAAGILPAATQWWSFSAPGGGGMPPAQNCTNGTSTGGNGRAGQSDATAGSFLNGGGIQLCTNAYNLLCLCY